MRQCLYHIAILLLLGACNKPCEQPVWANPQKKLVYPDMQLRFISSSNNWSASLLSFVQPINLTITYHKGGFTLTAPNRIGIIEGPAQICLSAGGRYFYYPFNLINKDKAAIAQKEYRCPKTVNCDSSLQQQRMLHAIDAYRNLVGGKDTASWFDESVITLAPRAGTYRALANEPLSAFYVQPGSCVNIPLATQYDKEKKCFTVTAGPLRDKYENTVADGSLVAFEYYDQSKTFRMEAVLQHGYASVSIPVLGGESMRIKAKLNETTSATIQLIQ
jgi:hypothetical protein